MFRAVQNSRNVVKIFAAVIFARQAYSAYKQNQKIQQSDVTLYGVDTCSVDTKLTLWHDSSSTFFRKDQCIELHAPVTINFAKKTMTLQRLDTELIKAQVDKILTKNPELKSELTPFLDNKNIQLLGRFDLPNLKNNDYTVELQVGTSKLKPLLCFNHDEVIYIRPPQVKTPESMKKFRALRKAFLFPKPIRDLILVNQKLMKKLGHKKLQITDVKYIDGSFEFMTKLPGEEKMVHTFQKTLGMWRYAGESMRNSWRQSFHHAFGFSPV